MNSTYDMLVKKSIEAFLLGLEIYNKPTIRYRVEGFSFFICNSWELMLKAKLINDKGENSIYFKDNPSRTVSLEYSIKEIFTNKHDPLRLNLEKIVELRNVSTHFITEDYEVIYAPLFQSCVFNYIEKMSMFHNIDVTEYITQSFLSLVIKEDDLDPAIIRSKYSKETADKILTTKKAIEKIELENNPAFSIDIQHNFYITKKINDADSTVRIAKEGEIPVKIIKEQKDPNKTHPYTQKNCVKEINKILSREKIDFEHFSVFTKEIRSNFNTADFQLFLKFYSLKAQERYS
ncbi:DUF3644 domain-containing protein, partial [Listeria monocytogenes]|nr:DUF3644 domain-containing protein [Listeria monocytogenes]ECO1905110.1 DUF3644 domain-containing protein [Listeria monocytogenes]ECO2446570.1 DUF3644 domain-containing protein [Listeria monocytogenes]EIO7020912.1 DUF3644 domain-containing protein [Listeria monocytogenes]EKS7001936.1 DUF3644 domain-containing protein [Listeria monocytogenes]